MLKYKGGGSLIGVPARDLTDEEAMRYGGRERLVASGLYMSIRQKADQPPTENKNLTPDAGNKSKPKPVTVTVKSGNIATRSDPVSDETS